MELLALSIAPGIAICLFIFHRDAYNREPKRNLLFAFVLGAFAILPAVLIEQYFFPMVEPTIAGIAVQAFLVVALTEELVKFLVLRYYAFNRKSFDEPLDGIVYAVVISMGFATLENVLYVQKYGLQVAFLRMFLAVPAHATFGVLMGYYAGKAKFEPGQSFRLLLTGLFWATFFHGAYDFFLFLQGNPDVKDYVSDGALFIGAVLSFIIAIRLSLKHIRMHRRLSQQTFNPTETMSLRKAYPGDISLIRELSGKIWPVTYASILSPQQIDYMLGLMYSPEALHEQMEKGHEFIIAYDGVEPVGFASFSLVEPRLFKLHKIYVLPARQGRGTGRFIIERLLTAMQAKGATALQLNVNRHNRAKEFYEKLGFTVVGEEDIDIGQGYFMNDYVMEKKIGES